MQTNKFGNIIFLLITVLSVIVPYPANAALNFTNATSNIVTVTAASSTNTLTNASILMWVYPTSLVADRVLMRKGSLVTTGWNIALNGTGGNLRSVVGQSGGGIDYITNTTPLATTNKWYCVALTWDVAGAAGQKINIYTGDLTTPLVEATYGTSSSGAGGQNNDSAVNIGIGNLPTGSPTSAFPGYIANAMLINRTVPVGELISLQYHPRKVSGTVGLWHLGFNGTGTQTDYSGTGNNGTVTGATVIDHVPLGALSLFGN